MRVYGVEIPDLLIKVCEEEKFAKDVIEGNLYMKESGYFRKLEDNYRGDNKDGKMPIRGTFDIIKENIDGKDERFSEAFPHIKIDNEVMVGVKGDDKYPIFCSTLLDEKILITAHDRGNNKVIKFKTSYINEMKRFGEYVVVFSKQELLSKLKEKVTSQEYKCIINRNVDYVHINKKYNLNNIGEYSQIYAQFFNKDVAYTEQNEFRVLIPDGTLISQDKDYYRISIGKFVNAQMYHIDQFNRLVISSKT